MDRPRMANRVILGPLLLCNILGSYEVICLQQLPGVKEYEMVYPQKLYALYRRNAENRTAEFPDEVHYGLKLQGKDVVMHLERNEHLFARNYTETHYSLDRQAVTTSPFISHHCYYHGYMRNESDTEASISLCDGVRGFFKTKGQRYLIEPLMLAEDGKHAVYKDETQEISYRTCGVTDTTTWTRTSPYTYYATNKEKQEFLNAKKYVKLVVVADNRMFQKYGQNSENVRKRIFEAINYVNMVYKALNVFVALIGTEIWDSNDQIEVISDHNILLERFVNWRRNNLLNRIQNDNAQLLTNIRFKENANGLAYISTMCSPVYSGGICMDQGSVGLVGSTVAHELGHNLGMKHDEQLAPCICPERPCVMAGRLRTWQKTTTFSSCSLKSFKVFLLDNMPVCMKIKPLAKDVKTPAVCGNEFTEIGEDCDCGTPKDCKNHCCDAQKCKFKPNPLCAEGECCENCKFKQRGVLCRPSKDDCDLPEICNGKSAVCPSDRFRMNGFPCNKDKGYCHLGTCPTLLDQCINIWGPSVELAPDYCFDYNTKSNYYGFCTYSQGSFIACNSKDVKCGKLYCAGGYSEPSVWSTIIPFTACKTIIPKEGYVENFAIARTGTKCGNGLVCIMNQCVDVEIVYQASINCTKNCTGHGVCDHENLCQCAEGWEGPKCDQLDPTFPHHDNQTGNSVSLDSSSARLLLVGYIILIPMAATRDFKLQILLCQ